MKKHILIIIIISGLLVSCEDYLNKAPELGLSEAVVFNNFTSIQGYFDQTNNLLNDFSHAAYLDGGVQVCHVSQMSDEAANPYSAEVGQFIDINKGSWLGATKNNEVGWGAIGIITASFNGLSICNRIIEKGPSMTILTQEQKNGLLGQSHFFRAWFYFEIIRRVGGMPLLDRVFLPNDNFDEERLTYQQSSDWAINELDEAIQFLPDEWPIAETGRPNKVAAYALKSMMELYSASPLMCNPIDKIENNGYDIERCKKAAEYAKQTLDYIEQTVPKHKMMPGSAYTNIFYHTPNFVSDESLFYVNNVGRTRHNDIIRFWQNLAFSNKTGTTGLANVDPTQNMIDLYETKNGYPVKLVGSNWVTDDPAFNQSKPFENRDPRLSLTIILPGEQFGSINNNPNFLCTWVGGRDLATPADGTNSTGYLCKKWMWPSSVDPRTGTLGYTDYNFNTILIRTAQVWLDYAEAMNEAYGPTNNNGYAWSAVDAINMVRTRVGMCPVRSEYTSSKEIFRERIRNERAVELMFENNRWFDLRRWMIAIDVFNPAGDTNPIKGVTVTATAVGKYDSKISYTDKVLPGNVFSYQLKSVSTEVRVFQMKHYWYPMGQDEAARYTKFKQNPGW